jgi:hypothetical protein
MGGYPKPESFLELDGLICFIPGEFDIIVE